MWRVLAEVVYDSDEGGDVGFGVRGWRLVVAPEAGECDVGLSEGFIKREFFGVESMANCFEALSYCSTCVEVRRDADGRDTNAVLVEETLRT